MSVARAHLRRAPAPRVAVNRPGADLDLPVRAPRLEPAPLERTRAAPTAPVPTARAPESVRPWEARLETVRDPTIAAAALAVAGGLPLDVLVEPLRSKVRALVEAGAAPADPAEVYARTTSAVGEATVKRALGELAVAVNRTAHAAAAAKPNEYGIADALDWNRGWGLALLPVDDPVFSSPDYLVALNQESGQLRSLTGGRPSVTRAERAFSAEWARHAPNARLFALADTGSEAVNLCFELAIEAGRRRLGLKKGPGSPTPTLAYFAGCYGAGRGQGSGMSFETYNEARAPDLKRFELPSPTSTTREPTSPLELARLELTEAAALGKLRALAADREHPIGAIFLEPIQGANGVRFYRTEFLQKLRALADELGLPIVADEVLTGGGRTGKFFAYQHYEGFEPDVVTFGKGLQVAGLAAIDRAGQKRSQRCDQVGVTTIEGDPVRLLKATKVLERIREGRLVENAAEVGAYLLEQLREHQRSRGLPVEASGVGCLLGARGLPHWAPSSAEGNDRRRYLPPITLTRAQVDEAIRVMEGQRR